MAWRQGQIYDKGVQGFLGSKNAGPRETRISDAQRSTHLRIQRIVQKSSVDYKLALGPGNVGRGAVVRASAWDGRRYPPSLKRASVPP